MNERIREMLVKLRRQLELLYGRRLIRVLVYGSQARGDAGRSSDIDVAVVLKGPVDSYLELHRTEELVADLSLDFDTVIHCKFVDEESYVKGNRPLLQSIQREGISV